MHESGAAERFVRCVGRARDEREAAERQFMFRVTPDKSPPAPAAAVGMLAA